MIVIANVNDRWVAITVFVERDLGVATATSATATCRGKLGTPEEICRGTDNRLCLVDPLNPTTSQGSPTNVVYNVCIYIIYIIRDTIPRVRLELPRSKLYRFTIICALVVTVAKAITTDIVCTECLIKESGGVRKQTAAYRIRLNMLL